MRNHALLEAVDALYRSVLETDQRDRVPELTGELINADLTSVWCFSTDYDHAEGRDYGDDAAFAEYMNDWVGRDEVIHQVLTTHRGTTADMETVLGNDPSLRSAPAFEGFYDRHDFVNAAGHFRSIAAGWVGGIAALRNHRRGPFTATEKACLHRLGPHIERALALSVHLETLDARSAASERLLSDTGLTMIACTPEGRILDHTPRAESALREETVGLGLRHGRISADDRDTAERLRAALQHAGRGRLPPTELGIPGRGGRRTWCTVLPLPFDDRSVAEEPHNCLVLLHLPGDRDLIAPERVARSLALSPAEGDVLAGLMRGEDLPAIASRRGSSVETIRSYEKTLRRKVECHSRAELVAKAWSTLATIPAVPA